jgi:hypothetical protein
VVTEDGTQQGSPTTSWTCTGCGADVDWNGTDDGTPGEIDYGHPTKPTTPGTGNGPGVVVIYNPRGSGLDLVSAPMMALQPPHWGAVGDPVVPEIPWQDTTTGYEGGPIAGIIGELFFHPDPPTGVKWFRRGADAASLAVGGYQLARLGLAGVRAAMAARAAAQAAAEAAAGMGEAAAGGAAAGGIRVTAKGLARVEGHLAQLDALEEPANAAMLARLRAGETAAQDINFYMHELKESAVMARTGGYTGYDAARAAHMETLQWQGIPYAAGYESQLYHPSVIRAFSEMFNPAGWPK